MGSPSEQRKLSTKLLEKPHPASRPAAAMLCSSYATAFPKGREAAVAPFVEAAKMARSLGLGLNWCIAGYLSRDWISAESI